MYVSYCTSRGFRIKTVVKTVAPWDHGTYIAVPKPTIQAIHYTFGGDGTAR